MTPRHLPPRAAGHRPTWPRTRLRTRQRTRRLTAALVGLGLVSTGPLLPTPAQAADPLEALPPLAAEAPAYAVQPVSGHTDFEAESLAGGTDISSDGDVVLYQANVGSWNGYLVRDRVAGTTAYVDHAFGKPTTPADWYTDLAVLSGDGGTVAFVSSADDILDDGGTGRTEVYLWDRATGTTERLARPAGIATGDVEWIDISDDGSRLAMQLDPDWEEHQRPRIVTLDLGSNQVLAEREIPHWAMGPVVSGDGSTVAWVEDLPDPEDPENSYVTRLFRAPFGTLEPQRTQTDFGADMPHLDRTGDKVVYRDTDERVVVAGTGPTGSPVPLAAGVESARNGRLSGDGSTVVYDDAPYDEGHVVSSVWSVSLADGTVSRVAGGTDPEQSEDPENPTDDDPTTNGVNAAWPAVSADGATVALYLDQGIVSAVRSAGAADTTAPEWPEGAELAAEPVDAGTLRLTWPRATDDVSLKGYEVTADGAPLATLGSARTSYDVARHDNDPTPVQYAVRAVDTSDNRSVALTTAARAAALLDVDVDGPAALKLDWEAAGPDVTAYRVLRAPGGPRADGSLGDPAELTQVAEVPAGTTTHRDADLRSLYWYDYRVDVVLEDGTTRRWTGVESEHTALPGPVPLTVDEERAHSLRLSWEPLPDSAPVKHYLVQRQQQSPDREVGWTQVDAVTPDEELRTTDAGLAPRASYLYRVEAVFDFGWPTRDWTQTTLGSTVSEGITDWDVVAPRTEDGAALILGGELVATATGEPGLRGELRLWETSAPGGAEPDVVLPMEETDRGTYLSDGYVLDGEEVDAVGLAEVRLVDGDRVYTRSGTVAPISGVLDLTVADSAEDLPGLELVLAGPRGTQRQPATAGSTAQVPLSPGFWDVSLVTSDGDVVARSSLTVQRAQRHELTLTPVRHAALTVTVQPPAGQDTAAQTVRVSELDGDVIATKQLNTATGKVSFAGLPARTTVRVSTHLADPSKPLTQPSAEVELGAGPSEITLRQETIASATVQATVAGEGSPIAGASVKVTQEVDGRPWTTTGKTGPDGTVSVPALVGEARVEVTAERHLSSWAPVTLVEGRVEAVSFDLVRAPTYLLEPQVWTTNAGADPVRQPMDWATNTHLRVSMTVNGKPLTGIGPVMPHVGTQGDVVRLCANGLERELSQGCASVTLGTDASVPIRLDLTQAARVSAHLVDETGADVTWAGVQVYRLVTNGMTLVHGRPDVGAQPQVGVAEAGTYQVVFYGPAGQSAPMQVTLSRGELVDLGRIELRGGSGLVKGATFDALPDPVLPGSQVTFRVGLPAAGYPGRTAIRFTVPGGTTLAPGGVTVDGKAVQPQVEGDLVTVPVPASGAAVVRYVVRVPQDVSVEQRLGSYVQLVHDAGATTSQIGTITAAVAGVTVTGPRTVTTPEVALDGLAPAGSTVALTQDGERIGTAIAGPGGRWDATAVLREPIEGAWHTVDVGTDIGGTTLRSAISVRYEPDFLLPTRVYVDNAGVTAAGSRTLSFDPRQGVAEFTMVYVPNKPITVRSEFEDASRVRDYVAHVGSATAAGTCDATTCTAVVTPGSSAEVGDIWVDYSVDGIEVSTLEEMPVPTVDDLRRTTTAPFNDPELLESDEPDTVRLGLGGSLAEVTAKVSTRTEEYTPTAEDQVLSSRSGVPSYGLSITPQETADGVQLRLRANIPHAFLGVEEPAGLKGPTEKQWTTFLELLFNIKAGTQVTLDQLKGMFNAGDEEEEYLKMQDYVANVIQPCAPDIAAEMYNTIEFSYMTTLYYRWTSDALNSLAMAGAKWTKMGDGLLAFAVETAIGEYLDFGIGEMISAEVDATKAEIYQKPKCDKRIKWIPPNHKFPTAKPTWIYDPSGYTYEALGEHRVEGVTATILSGASPTGPWVPWDAEEYGQTNPQVTLEDGRYAWDVTPGWWKVRFEKDGYRTAETEPMEVLPERYDVNVNLHRLAAPALTGVAYADGGVDLTFDEWMRVDEVASKTRVQAGSTTRPGTVSPVEPATSPDGEQLAKRFRFVPATPFTGGEKLTVTVNGSTADHGQVTLGADAVRQVSVPGGSQPPPQPSWCRDTTLSLSPTSVRAGEKVIATATTKAWTLVGFYAAPVGRDRFSLIGIGLADRRGRTAWSFKPRTSTQVFARQIGCSSRSAIATVKVR